MPDPFIPEPSAASREPLLGRRAVALIVVFGLALFGASIPLVGWEQALGSFLAAFAGLLLAVGLAEPLVHRLQGVIEDRNVSARQRAVASDVLRVVSSPVWILAEAAISDWNGRKPPDQVNAVDVLKVLDEAEGELRIAETRAMARGGGWIRPDLTDEEATAVGLPSAGRRWWCADGIARSLEPVRYEISERIHAVGVDERIAQAVREICFSVQPTWQFLAGQGLPQFYPEKTEQERVDHEEGSTGPTPGAFLHAAADTFTLCRVALECIEASTVLNVLVPLVRQRQAGDPYLTSWDAVRAEKDRASGTDSDGPPS